MRISKVEIKSFRGIPEQLTIDFPIKNRKNTSLIIIGDNGSGKSSIIDAIEFCLQGHISQTGDFNDKHKPSIISLSNLIEMPKVKVTLDDGTTFERKVIEDEEQGYLTNQKSPHISFAISPFVLRRNDILRFIDAPDAEKTLVFANYLRRNDAEEWIETPKDELKKLQDERLASKEKRDILLTKLASTLKINVEDIPLDTKSFKLFEKEHIYKGLDKKQIANSNLVVKLNEKAISLTERINEEILNHRRIKKIVTEYSLSNKVDKFPRHLLPQLNEFLLEIGNKLTHSFLEISPLNFIENFSVVYDKKNILALKIIIHLKNNKNCTPSQILSEANLDLLALLFYISFVQESAERGQAKIFILDDVLQSIDATIRVSFINYILKYFNDWQFVITAHDRLWHRQLCDLMNQNGHIYTNIHITKWSFNEGSKLNYSIQDPCSFLTKLMDEGEVVAICSQAGILLEEVCDKISVNLSTSIHRRKDDKYTIGDLWPSISKLLNKTTINSKIENVNKWLHLRNIIGAHYNEWATSLSLDEAKQFGQSILDLINSLKCDECKNWIIATPSLDFYSCKCGKIRIQKK